MARREIRNSTNTDGIADCEPGKLCPMCEAAFPGDVDPEAFESHVVEHFCFEEAETIKYVAQDDQQPQLQLKTMETFPLLFSMTTTILRRALMILQMIIL